MTKKHQYYLTTLIIKIVIFVILTIFIWLEMFDIVNVNLTKSFEGFGFFKYLSPLHLVWLLMMIYIIINISNWKIKHPAGQKAFKEYFLPTPCEKERIKMAQKVALKGMIKVIILYLIINLAASGLFLYLKVANIVNKKNVLLFLNLQLFYYMFDYFCIVFWCPLQSWLMHNRCCRTCRIFNWGTFMIQVPMLFTTVVNGFSFYGLSLLVLSFIDLIGWEIKQHKHPEYFYEVSNSFLSCKNCTDHFCKTKKRIG